MVRVIRKLALLLVFVPTVAAGQSLVDVAKAEDARRKSVDKPAKVYTNGDLRSDVTPATSPATPAGSPATERPAGEAASPSAAPAKAASGPAPAAGAAKDEAYWKNRYSAALDAVNRSKMFLDALQSRINALTTQVINRDDPYQQASLEQDRQKNLAELERVKRDIDSQTKEISAIEEEARRAGVPPGWLR